MAWVRQLASGLWAATVYTPAGRITESDEHETIIRNWANDLEADIRRGKFHDPRLAKKHVGEAWEKYSGSRRIEKPSRARDASTWRCHVEPRWGKVPVGEVVKPDVQDWVNNMERSGIGGWTIVAALNVLKTALELAIDAGWIQVNAARRVKTPIAPDHVDRVFTAAEEHAFLERLDELFPGRRDARLFVEMLLETGTRWEEAAAVRKEAVDLRAAVVQIGPVMERDGNVRDYPKGARSRQAAGFRHSPIGDDFLRRLRPVVMATPARGLVFTAPMGGPLRYPTWLDRVWNLTLRGRPAEVLSRAPKGAFNAEAFGMWLDGARERSGHATDKDVALAGGFHKSLLSNWRAGTFAPSRERANRLAVALGVEPVEVYAAVGLAVPEIPGLGFEEPLPTPHDCRHTFGTRLAEARVEMHDRMALMGHKDHRSAERYTHSGHARFDRARQALAEARRGAFG